MPSRGPLGSSRALGHDEPRAVRRQPRIDAGVRGDELDVADAELGREVDQRVLGARLAEASWPTRSGEGGGSSSR